MENELEILEASYWEHFKKARDLSLYLPLKDVRRIDLETEMTNMLNRINKMKNGISK